MEKKLQQSYSAEYRHEAVELANRTGVSAAARELGIPLDTLYTWVSKSRKGLLPMAVITPEPHNTSRMANRIKELEQENKRLRT